MYFMARIKKDNVPRQTFSTLVREDIYMDLHQVMLNDGMKDIYLLVEEALDEYLDKKLPERTHKVVKGR